MELKRSSILEIVLTHLLGYEYRNMSSFLKQLTTFLKIVTTRPI